MWPVAKKLFGLSPCWEVSLVSLDHSPGWMRMQMQTVADLYMDMNMLLNVLQIRGMCEHIPHMHTREDDGDLHGDSKKKSSVVCCI